MAHYIRKTVVIGLGGTGLRIALHVKRKLIDAYGKVPLCYKFLVIDTADKEDLTYRGRTYSLEGGEFFSLSVEDPAEFIEINQIVRNWFPPNVPKRQLVDGAGQIRSLGRLGMYFHADSLLGKVRDIINDVNSYRVGHIDQDMYELISDDRLVIIVGSLAGGTGSGVLLELGALVRSMLRTTEKTLGMFLLPDGFVSLPGCDRVLPNAYAALKEIDYLSDLKAATRKSFKFGSRDIAIKYVPYSRVFLINNSAQESRFSFDNLDSLMEMMASGILVASGSVGKKDRDIWDNLQSQLKGGVNWLGRNPNYCSFGVSELVFDREGYVKVARARASLSALDSCFMSGSTSETQSRIDGILEELHLREEEPNNEVIDRILSPSDVYLPSRPEPTGDNVINLLKRRGAFIEDQEFQLRDAARQRSVAFIEEVVLLLEQTIREMIRINCNLSFVHEVLRGLLARVDEFKAMMINERSELNRQVASIESTYDGIAEDARNASRKLIGGRKAREEVIDDYLATQSRHLQLLMEIERRRAAVNVFSSISDSIETWARSVDRSKHNLEALRATLGEMVSRGVSSSRSLKPFEIFLPYPSNQLAGIQVNESAFKSWLKTERQLEVDDLINKSEFELKSILFEFTDTLPTVQKISASSIEDVLSLMPEEKRWEYIKRLNTMASPLWEYRAVYTEGNLVQICIFGVGDPDQSILEDKTAVRKLLNLDFEPSNVAHGDALRILCFKIEAIVPAYVLEGFDQYKELYDRQEEVLTSHMGKDYFDLPELTPIRASKESRKYWSVAHAPVFDLITKKGSGDYSFRSKSKGKAISDFLISLAKGRVAAMDEFLQNKETLDEAIREIDVTVDKLGRVEVADRLKEYRTKLIDSFKRRRTISADLRNLINLEVQDIDEFVSDLESMI